MPKTQNKEATAPRWDSEISLLAWLATSVSVFSFLFYFQRGEVLLYGDAVAHINIARRVFDSKTPGLLQLGTVWLPLPHLLMIPFIISMKMWRTGAGGSIPSMGAYVFGVVGIFRLTRGVLSHVTLDSKTSDPTAHLAAWLAAVVYAANPNLIYMQSTAMGESIYLALFIWAVLFFLEAARGNRRSLIKCGFCLVGACLTRYDGWFLAAAMIGLVVLDSVRGGHSLLRHALAGGVPEYSSLRGRAALQGRVSPSKPKGALAPVVVKFVLLAAFAPSLWLAYNAIVYRNPLEFANGPYSAKAIERRTQTTGNPGHPGSGSLRISELYFFKAAQETWAGNEDLQRAAVIWLVFGCIAGVIVLRRFAFLLLLLLLPILFYALSIRFGGVPIFDPHWWPFSHYNTRYGLELLPAFAFSIAMVFYLSLRPGLSTQGLITACRWVSIAGCIVLVVGGYGSIWRSGPITLQEAQINMRTRNQLEKELATWLQRLPDNATLLMYLGDHVGAVERAGIPLSHTINEGNHRTWKQPSDPEGLWERALANPQQHADYVLAFEGDPVWQAVHSLHLRELVAIHVTGQAPAVLYRIR